MRTLTPRIAPLVPRRPQSLAIVANSTRRPSQSITDRQKLRTWLKQEGRCACCGVVVALTEADLDHVLPLCDGGGVGDDNVQVLRRECHRDKTNAEITARAQLERSKWPSIRLKG
jgi:5-methylcytosine-specific restriction endonuclease McrA